LIRFRLIQIAEIVSWISTIWDAEFFRQWIEQRAATSAGQHNISMTMLAKTPVPVPSLAEQECISAEVDRRLSVIETFEAAAEANSNRADRLRQSVLGSVFSGRPPNGKYMMRTT
jgi:type I restriction enzyme S subunit